jgi:hypothetical protein
LGFASNHTHFKNVTRVRERRTCSPETTMNATILKAGAIGAFALLYTAPILVALTYRRGHQVEAVLVNGLLGWTGLGWAFALYLALLW